MAHCASRAFFKNPWSAATRGHSVPAYWVLCSDAFREAQNGTKINLTEGGAVRPKAPDRTLIHLASRNRRSYPSYEISVKGPPAPYAKDVRETDGSALARGTFITES